MAKPCATHPERPALAWGLCRACYDRARKAGTLPQRPPRPTHCACGARAVKAGQCTRCYFRAYRANARTS